MLFSALLITASTSHAADSAHVGAAVFDGNAGSPSSLQLGLSVLTDGMDVWGRFVGCLSNGTEVEATVSSVTSGGGTGSFAGTGTVTSGGGTLTGQSLQLITNGAEATLKINGNVVFDGELADGNMEFNKSVASQRNGGVVACGEATDERNNAVQVQIGAYITAANYDSNGLADAIGHVRVEFEQPFSETFPPPTGTQSVEVIEVDADRGDIDSSSSDPTLRGPVTYTFTSGGTLEHTAMTAEIDLSTSVMSLDNWVGDVIWPTPSVMYTIP